jgi:ABC-type transport system involved in multi-copper enzyme maturation permease subunit
MAINWPYIRFIWRTHLTFVIFSTAFITLFQFLLLFLVTTFDTEAFVSVVLEQMPPPMRAFLQDSFFSMLNFDGAAAFGFNHPIVITLLVIISISIPVNHITHEIESGTLELLLAHPFKRGSLLISLWLSGLLILFTIITIALAGSYTSILIFHELNPTIFVRLLEICFNLWLLMMLILSYSMLIAIFSRAGTKTGNLSAAITFFFYLLFFLSQLWDVLEFTQTFNLFNYYEPQEIMLGKGNYVMDVSILVSAIIIVFGINYHRFNRRDIP